MWAIRIQLFDQPMYFGAFQARLKVVDAMTDIQIMFPDVDDGEVIQMEHVTSPASKSVPVEREAGETWLVEATVANKRRYFGAYRTKEAALANVKAVHPDAADIRAHLLFHP